MTGRDFCYWLQGFFEISENLEDDIKDIKLTDKQVKIIRSHLNLVFTHEIDPSNLDGKTPTQKKMYQRVHDGAVRGDDIIDPIEILNEFGKNIDHSKVEYNC
jgi:hypothetical protein